MIKLFKFVAWMLGLLVAALVAAVVIIPMLFDPNDYREEIGALVKKHTGRELTIEGRIELSVFPWLGAQLGAMQLSNAEGFGPEPFARIGSADVRIKLLPLLRKEVEMEKIILHGLEANLGRHADGRSNWDDLVAPAAAGSAEEPAAQGDEKSPSAGGDAANPMGALAALSLGGLELRDARLSWDDRQAEARYAVDRLNLSIGAVELGKPFALEMNFNVNSSEPQLQGHIQLASRITLDLQEQRYRLDATRLAADLQSAMFPGGRVDARLAANIEADIKAQTVSVAGLKLDAYGLALQGQLQGQQILANPQLSGHLQSEEFVPRDLVDRLAVELPEMADPSTLTKASIRLGFAANSQQAVIENLDVRFDDSSLQGRLSVSNFQRPALRYDFTLDAIDADRYLPPPGEEPAAPVPPASAAAAGATTLPPETIAELRALDLAGTMRIGKLKVMNLRSSDLHATVNAKDGLLRVHPVGASLYDGHYEGNLSLDLRGKEPLIGMDEKLAAVQAAPLLKDFMGEDYVSGTANLSAQLTAQGLDPEQVRRSLNGKLAFSFTDGAVNGINIAQLIRNAYATYQKQPAPKDEVRSTDFALISGSATVQNGLLTNNDLKAESPLFRVNGQGTAHLASEELDYLVKAAIVGSLEGQGGKELSELKGLTVPLRITGRFSEPKFSVDLASLLDARLQQKLDAEKERLQEKLDAEQQRLQEKLDAEKQQLQEKMDAEKQKMQEKIDTEKKKAEDKLKEKLMKSLMKKEKTVEQP